MAKMTYDNMSFLDPITGAVESYKLVIFTTLKNSTNQQEKKFSQTNLVVDKVGAGDSPGADDVTDGVSIGGEIRGEEERVGGGALPD